ncbi:hypothetical protein DPMN_082112 [Dreissena polymorpha]|uniref:Uncharacterized protein n=1 Tax=Dreissena polymorpha TaxID=45954 RepID=A0A9D4B9U3_DREPO|nr:hypothetical protein DPMN_082112 [Dreissena polymorpha]
MIDIYGNVDYGVNPGDVILEKTPVEIALNCDRPESVMSGKAYDRKSNCASSSHEYTADTTTQEQELNAEANTNRTNTIPEKDFNILILKQVTCYMKTVHNLTQ